MWLQVVNQKQLKPLITENDSQINNLRKNLLKEWQIILESLGFKKNPEHEAKVYSVASFPNILRVGQSMARDIQKNEVDDSILSKSYKLFVQNAEGLINNEDIQHQVKVVIPGRYESKKFNAVRVELSVSLLDINGLFTNVKQYFKDIYELQTFIDKLKLGGSLYEPKREYYLWI